MVFQIRRTVFVAIMFALKRHPGIQLLLFIYLSVLYIIYLNFNRIYHEPFHLLFETANECGLMLVCYHLVLFTNLVSDPLLHRHIGTSLILTVGTCFAMSIISIFSITIRDQVHKLKIRWNKRKYDAALLKKEEKCEEESEIAEVE